ncbi:hypothetical protein BP5796_07057 [Coleophoma crateriformis]|uniref:Uncharacterized protein n=1 Tax=Coleophoma crateriformis TaxID=565419 RepID=A0A3D8RHT8_9HELO|nr:hypothetical protein BP5796_07057 [Coleophoma crateriformis]
MNTGPCGVGMEDGSWENAGRCHGETAYKHETRNQHDESRDAGASTMLPPCRHRHPPSRWPFDLSLSRSVGLAVGRSIRWSGGVSSAPSPALEQMDVAVDLPRRNRCSRRWCQAAAPIMTALGTSTINSNFGRAAPIRELRCSDDILDGELRCWAEEPYPSGVAMLPASQALPCLPRLRPFPASRVWMGGGSDGQMIGQQANQANQGAGEAAAGLNLAEVAHGPTIRASDPKYATLVSVAAAIMRVDPSYPSSPFTTCAFHLSRPSWHQTSSRQAADAAHQSWPRSRTHGANPNFTTLFGFT